MDAFPWLQSYPPGVRWDAPIRTMPVTRLLDEAIERWPDRPALEFMGKRLSYREVGALSDRAAAGLQRLGVQPGTRVGLYLPNTPHYVIAFFGILKAGGIVVSYSPLDAARVIEHKARDSGTELMITLDVATLYPNAARLLAGGPLERLVVGEIAEMTPAPDAVRAQMKAGGQTVAVPEDERHSSFARLLDNDGRYQPHPVEDVRETIAALQYTGGTTGLPKGAMLTHANLTAACEQYWLTSEGDPKVLEEGNERFLVVLPLFHIYALTVNLLLGMRAGAELVLHPRFDLEAVVRDLVAKRITVFPGVPTMYTALLSVPGIEKLDLSALKFCGSGGAPLPADVQIRFEKATGCGLCEGWGMTETSPTGTFTPVYGRHNPGSCGLPMPGVEIRFVSIDDPSRTLPYGERGEIVVRGPNVMKGYWNRPEATAESMTPDGFFRTGDAGYMDEEGWVYIIDRTKDMLLCGGFNVYPRIIEDALYTHPDVEEAIVIGIPDEYRGQSPKAFVKLRAGATAPTLEQMKAFLADHLGKHEMIGALEVREQLPRTPVGKLSKKELYEEEERRRKG